MSNWYHYEIVITTSRVFETWQNKKKLKTVEFDKCLFEDVRDGTQESFAPVTPNLGYQTPSHFL